MAPERRIGKTTQVLRSTFNRLSPDELDRLRHFATVTTYPASTVLCREGEVGRTFYVLRSGAAKLTQRVSDTEERILMLRGPGQFFGEMTADDSPYTMSVTTINEATVIEITKETFEQVLTQSPALAMTLLQQAQSDLRASMQQQIVELQEKNAALAQAYTELQAAQAQLVATERVKRELEIAAQLQRSILPVSFPQLWGLSFAAHARPAREMGGDFYDVFPLDENHVGLLVADVSDKSIPAAMFMAVSHTLFYTESHRSLSPGAVVATVNESLLHTASTDMFVTAFYGVLDVKNRRLTYVRAGHDRPLLQHADGSFDMLAGDGRFLGMLDGLVVEECEVTLQPGDRLVLYSDGIIDATNHAGEQYTLERLQPVVACFRALEAQPLADAILGDVLSFQGEADQFDDITLLVAAVD